MSHTFNKNYLHQHLGYMCTHGLCVCGDLANFLGVAVVNAFVYLTEAARKKDSSTSTNLEHGSRISLCASVSKLDLINK